MISDDDGASQIEQLLDTPDLAAALESDRFKQFLDRVPIAVAVSALNPVERVVYANLEFERLSGQLNTTMLGRGWQSLPGEAAEAKGPSALGEAIVEGDAPGLDALRSAPRAAVAAGRIDVYRTRYARLSVDAAAPEERNEGRDRAGGASRPFQKRRGWANRRREPRG